MGIRTGTLLRKTAAFITCFCLVFFQAVIFVTTDTCAQSPPPAPQATGPIDIQAAEQDFADDQVIAKGNVRVKYKDSLIVGPMATLFRDAAGQPQRAVFVGHPSLTQGESKMHADTLIFEIATSKIIAQGHAHSEVTSDGDTDTDITPVKSGNKAKAPSNATAGGNGKQPFKWPQQ